jgi:hypothetical protein
VASVTAPRPRLIELVAAPGTLGADEMLARFVEWTSALGLELYPAQEEALLEVFAGRHVVLATPTGSGKSLVAIGLHFKALCEGRISYYTSPIKALASEKFFALCAELGADNVGMLTGDASINPDAPVICCTAEVLANLALRLGGRLDADAVVMDEFHYYADRERGWAWQVPLVTLPHARFLLMSATLGDMSGIARRLEDATGVEAAVVSSTTRPVPLEFEWRETPLQETVYDLVTGGRAPVYVVNFTQRDCAELAQQLTSLPLTTKEDKAAIREALGDTRFETPYGREFRRFLSFGIGVHHAGLLPRYRLTVEQLAQRGLLKVVSGTDTLGVGVNIPIRTVLFTALAKFDGRRVAHLRVRDFLQIAGRAGRKGFDERGWVVGQAPEHVIERKREAAKAAKDGKKKPKAVRGPREGEVSWTEETFTRLRTSPPERLESRFKIAPGMVVDLLHRDADERVRHFHSLRALVRDCHEDDASKHRLLSRAAAIVRSLHREGIVGLAPAEPGEPRRVVVNEELQVDFSLFHTLSLFLVDGIARLDPDGETYALEVLSMVEAVLEDPEVIIRSQVSKAKEELLARLKAEDVPYEERIRRLDEVTHPQPAADLIEEAFERFRARHPWVGGRLVHPKSVAREMVETCLGFGEMVRRYGIQRQEGVLLRYLSQAYKTLDQNVPDQLKTEAVWEIAGFLRAVLERTDTSLLQEWESLVHPDLRAATASPASMHRRLAVEELLADPRRFAARIRGELHALVAALSRGEWEEAAAAIRQGEEGSRTHWSPAALEQAMAPFLARHRALVFEHRARLADKTLVQQEAQFRWRVTQVLCDPDGDDDWHLAAEIDLADAERVDGPLLTLLAISD